MVTGIITDAFGGIRSNTDSRRAMYKSESFIAGLTESDLDCVAGIYPSDLDKKQHNIWNYIYYAAYIESKDKVNDSGLESYVRSCIKKKDQSWMPHKICFALQAQKLLSEDTLQESISELQALKEKAQQSISEIQALKDLILESNASKKSNL
jgi:hypothetical protein